MSLKLGNTPIAGISTHTNVNAHSLFDCKWADHKLNEISWLEASTFSWQSGNVYTSAYNHLVQDIQGITAETETIGSYTVTFYRATDGHKICLADQETTVLNIYSETGIAWYYILDTVNTQFKLPRTKYGFDGLRTNVGDNINESLPNIKGQFPATVRDGVQNYTEGAFDVYSGTGGPGSYNGTWGFTFDASRSSSTYQNNAPVQERATQMYLYFYVGDYSQTAIEQTAGLNSELFNSKADINLANISNKLSDGFLDKLMPDWNNTINITSSFPYACPSSGYLYLRNYNGYIEISSNLNTSTFGYRITGTSQATNTGMYPVQLNEILTLNSTAGTSNMYFIPLKGAN